MKCPMCGTPCECDRIDVGSGEQQVGPWICYACPWVERQPSYGDMVESNS